MNTKRMSKWVIVLFLLAALPGMTAVMAQGPAEKEVVPAAVTDVGETTNVHYSVWETEPNNTMGQATALSITDPGKVVGGELYNGDVDWYKFYMPAQQTGTLIDIDAQIDGASTDSVVKLFNSAGAEMSSNDDMGGGSLDSLLFTVLQDVGWYYVQVSDFGGPCATNCSYELIITRPLLVSAAAAKLPASANVEGIPFRSEDVLALLMLQNDHNGTPQHKWLMFLDGSDIGITKAVTNIGLGWPHAWGSMSLTFGANQVWQDMYGINRTFKPWDWAVIAFERVGPNTLLWTNPSGYRAIEHHAGVEHGLTTAAEKPDALDLNAAYAANPAWTANLFFSTTGAGSVPKAGGGILKPADEDVFRSTVWDGMNPYVWQNYLTFDGSTVAGLAAEDIFAADYEAARDRIALVILGTGNVLGHAVTQKDIFFLDKSGSNWVWHTMIHLPDYGWNYNLDAVESGGN